MGQHFLASDRTKRRLVNHDGTMNISKGKNGHWYGDLYHRMVSSSWSTFVSVFLLTYLFTNLFFGFLYWLVPQGQFEGMNGAQVSYSHFWECFFFSVQTFGTIGYGRMSPVGFTSNWISTIESMISLFLVALGTGMVFARFSKPIAKIIFSRRAVIRNFEDGPWFMFRLANERQNHITDARVKVTFVYDEEGTGYRTFKDLDLELSVNPIFALSWVIAHPINERSPMYGLSLDDLNKKNAEMIVTFSGTDTTLSQTVYSKFSYIVADIMMDHDFVDVIARNENGTLMLMLEHFHEVKPLSTGP